MPNDKAPRSSDGPFCMLWKLGKIFRCAYLLDNPSSSKLVFECNAILKIINVPGHEEHIRRRTAHLGSSARPGIYALLFVKQQSIVSDSSIPINVVWKRTCNLIPFFLP